MDCDLIKQKISVLTDNELDSKDILTVKEHITNCNECHKTYKDYLNVNKQLLVFKDIEPQNQIIIDYKDKTFVFGFFDFKKLIPVSAVISLILVFFISFIFAAPLLFGNNDTKKQTTKELINCYAKCVMKPSIGHSSFSQFCKGGCDIIGKCCCKDDKNMKCKGDDIIKIKTR